MLQKTGATEDPCSHVHSLLNKHVLESQIPQSPKEIFELGSTRCVHQESPHLESAVTARRWRPPVSLGVGDAEVTDLAPAGCTSERFHSAHLSEGVFCLFPDMKS